MEQRDALRAAVRRIAWGFLVILLDINLGTIDVLPNWLGYVWMVRALPVLDRETPTAHLLDPLGVLLAAWAFIVWLFKIFGHTADWPLPGLLATVIALYFDFQLLTNLSDIAAKYGWPRQKALLTLRSVQVLLLTGTYLLVAFFPNTTALTALVVVNLAVAIWICKTLFSFQRFLAEPTESPA